MKIPVRDIQRCEAYKIGATACSVAGSFHASPIRLRVHCLCTRHQFATHHIQRFKRRHATSADCIRKAEPRDAIIGDEIADDDVDFGYPSEVKKLIMEVSQEAAERSLQAITEAESEALEFLKKQGVTTVEFAERDAYNAAIPDMREVWFKSMVSKGLGDQAKTVLDYWRAKQAELE
ncbi:MAG: hypothetical protein FD175_2048 [Beijerinckiaceae bacterium]|nr:MAG: hypothetical protein FD175_2048 [Beijerinckiaceae bacterium]